MRFPVLTSCVLVIASALAAGAALGDERILAYQSDITVNVDGSMSVAEQIRVRAEGANIRRGIYRDFPTDYKDRFGNRYRVDFEVVSVTRDGMHSRDLEGRATCQWRACLRRAVRRLSRSRCVRIRDHLQDPPPAGLLRGPR
jgi:hypothetical protein